MARERGKRESTPQRHGDILPKAATSLGSALHALSVGCPSRLHTQLSASSLPLSFCHSFSLSLSLGAVAGSAHWKYFALSVMSCSKFRHSPKMYATALCDQKGHAAQLAIQRHVACGRQVSGGTWHFTCQFTGLANKVSMEMCYTRTFANQNLISHILLGKRNSTKSNQIKFLKTITQLV